MDTRSSGRREWFVSGAIHTGANAVIELLYNTWTIVALWILASAILYGMTCVFWWLCYDEDSGR